MGDRKQQLAPMERPNWIIVVSKGHAMWREGTLGCERKYIWLGL